jgi:hypothetical protein
METSDIIAFASFIVAFLSFFLTIATIKITQKHNKLSVKPILKFVPYDMRNKVAIYIENSGTGPLFRNKITCTNGTLISSHLIDLLPSHPDFKWSNFSKFEKFVIPPNGSETLIEIIGDGQNENFRDYITQLQYILKDVTITCEYSDIYNQVFPNVSINLHYCYGRHFNL